MINQRYIIFSDVDGTIYSHKQEWSKTTLSSIKKVMDGGIEFVVCTGNPYFGNMKKLQSKINNRYFIGSSGAIIYDVFENKEILLSTINDNDAQFTLDLCNELELSLHWWDSKSLFGNKHIRDGIEEILRIYIDPTLNLNKVDEVSSNIHKMEINVVKSAEEIEKLNFVEAKLIERGASLSRVSDTHMEITHKNANKGYAASYLATMLKVNPDNFMTVGDSANDWSMFESTPHSYAMGNSGKRTKDRASFITKDVLDDGLGFAMNDFLNKKNI